MHYKNTISYLLKSIFRCLVQYFKILYISQVHWNRGTIYYNNPFTLIFCNVICHETWSLLSNDDAFWKCISSDYTISPYCTAFRYLRITYSTVPHSGHALNTVIVIQGYLLVIWKLWNCIEHIRMSSNENKCLYPAWLDIIENIFSDPTLAGNFENRNESKNF